MAVDELCSSIFALVKGINQQVESMDELKEDARKLYRFIKRTEVLVSDLQPYAESSQKPGVLAALRSMEATLARIRSLLEDCCAKGKLSAFLQADHMLAQFKASALELHDAIGQLAAEDLATAEETQDDIESVRMLLQRARFELSAERAALLARYRDACDRLKEPFEQLQSSCKDILEQVNGERALTKEEYAASVADLQREVKIMRTQQQTADGDADYYLRMMMDLVRIIHNKLDTPIEFICPITAQIMQDPVVLVETGHTYERSAIEEWWTKGHKFCPKTGTPLKKSLNICPNTALRAAIARWTENSDMQLQFRPLLRTMTEDDTAPAGHDNGLFSPAFGAPKDASGASLPAEMSTGRLGSILEDRQDQLAAQPEAPEAAAAAAPAEPESNRDVTTSGADDGAEAGAGGDAPAEVSLPGQHSPADALQEEDLPGQASVDHNNSSAAPEEAVNGPSAAEPPVSAMQNGSNGEHDELA